MLDCCGEAVPISTPGAAVPLEAPPPEAVAVDVQEDTTAEDECSLGGDVAGAWHNGAIQWHSEACQRLGASVMSELDAILGSDRTDGLVYLADLREPLDGLEFADAELRYLFCVFDHNGNGKVHAPPPACISPSPLLY